MANGNSFEDALVAYREWADSRAKKRDEQQSNNQSNAVSEFYNAITPFYELGWGQRFHFSPRQPGEGLVPAQIRHEQGLAHVLELKAGMKVLDVGCGVGGPASNDCTRVWREHHRIELQRTSDQSMQRKLCRKKVLKSSVMSCRLIF